MPTRTVTIYTVEDDSSMKEFCRAELREGETEVSFVGPNAERFEQLMREEGIRGLMGRAYFPTDGRAFLENLKVEFSGSRMRASDVETRP